MFAMLIITKISTSQHGHGFDILASIWPSRSSRCSCRPLVQLQTLESSGVFKDLVDHPASLTLCQCLIFGLSRGMALDPNLVFRRNTLWDRRRDVFGFLANQIWNCCKITLNEFYSVRIAFMLILSNIGPSLQSVASSCRHVSREEQLDSLLGMVLHSIERRQRPPKLSSSMARQISGKFIRYVRR